MQRLKLENTDRVQEEALDEEVLLVIPFTHASDY